MIVSQAKKVTDKMFLRAAQVLSDHAPLLKQADGALFPHFDTLRAVSREIACNVALMAQEEGVAERLSIDELNARLDRTMWYPNYPTYCSRF